MEAFRPPAPLQFSLGNVKEKWRQELESYVLATEKDDRTDKIKIAILLNLLGSEGLETYNTFKLETKTNFSDVLQKFEEYCSPRQNSVYERLGYKNDSCEKITSTWKKTIEIVQAAEASREQIQNMKYDTATINFVKENQNKPKTQYNCKKWGRKHKPRECPAFGKNRLGFAPWLVMVGVEIGGRNQWDSRRMTSYEWL
ncbi:transposon Tf2-6 polyprotein [Trichonephila clavipes]|nr:transposon Tf2-6 polyprotein [Trichonephila clavipes]